jgi:hypothetical protein
VLFQLGLELLYLLPHLLHAEAISLLIELKLLRLDKVEQGIELL